MLARDQLCSSGATMSLRSPGKGKLIKSATPVSVATPMKLFQLDDESIILPKRRGVYFEDPNVEWALKRQEKSAASRRSSLSCRAAPVF